MAQFDRLLTAMVTNKAESLVLEDGEDQVVLALEMVVERLLADARVGKDAVEPDRMEPLAAE